ncbi:hypothetical protein ABT104_03345 [Streptomyces mobaraensis]|uniref:hypothetical protein n=1 Tax=Streptomyces mobaraensis TaxID=35621 RepID=UPI0033218DB1
MPDTGRERGALGGLQVCGAEEVGDVASQVEGDRQLRGGRVLLDGGVVGHEVGDGRADGAAADAVVAGQGCDRATLQVRGAYGDGLVGRDGGATTSHALERVEAAGGARLFLEDDRVLDPGFAQDEVLPGGGLLVGRDPLVGQIRHRGDPSVRGIGP